MNGRLVQHATGAWEWSVPMQRFRVMFEGGETVDVLAASDDSTLRAELVRAKGGRAIVGVTTVETPEAG